MLNKYSKLYYVLLKLFFALQYVNNGVVEDEKRRHLHTKALSLRAKVFTVTTLNTNETMDIFVVGFWLLTVVCIALFVLTHNFKSTGVFNGADSNFRTFQRLYLVVFLLAMGNRF